MTVESVPAAVGIFVAAGGDPLETVVGGTNIGNDTDTIAAMAGSLAGALHGIEAVPADLFATVKAVNSEDIEGSGWRLDRSRLAASQRERSRNTIETDFVALSWKSVQTRSRDVQYSGMIALVARSSLAFSAPPNWCILRHVDGRARQA